MVPVMPVNWFLAFQLYVVASSLVRFPFRSYAKLVPCHVKMRLAAL